MTNPYLVLPTLESAPDLVPATTQGGLLASERLLLDLRQALSLEQRLDSSKRKGPLGAIPKAHFPDQDFTSLAKKRGASFVRTKSLSSGQTAICAGFEQASCNSVVLGLVSGRAHDVSTFPLALICQTPEIFEDMRKSGGLLKKSAGLMAHHEKQVAAWINMIPSLPPLHLIDEVTPPVERQPPWPLPTTKLAGFDRCVLR